MPMSWAIPTRVWSFWWIGLVSVILLVDWEDEMLAYWYIGVLLVVLPCRRHRAAQTVLS